MGKNTNTGHYSIPTFLNSTTKIVVSTAILYFLIAKLSLYIFVTDINILPFFPAIGFAIAASLLLGRKAIFGVVIGCLMFSASLYKNDFQNASTFDELIKPLSLCIIRPIIAYLNTFLVSYLTQLWCKTKYPFDSAKNVIFFTLAGLLGTFTSVSIGFIPLAMTSFFSLDNCILIWSNILRGNTLGIIVFTPFVLSLLYKTKDFITWTAAKKAEAFILILFTLFATIFIFETRANNESILFFLLIWAACRFGMKVITLVTLIITIIATYCTGHLLGGFVFSGWNSDLFMLQLFLFVNMVSVLFLKAILKEKENKETNLKISQQTLNLKNNILETTIESPKGIFIYSLDKNYRILSCNSLKKEVMKKAYSVELKIGKSILECIKDKANQERYINFCKLAFYGKDVIFEDQFPNQTQYWQIKVSPIYDDQKKIKGITVVGIDITERIEAENKIKASQEKLGLNNSILQATIESPNGISIFSLDTSLNYINFNSTHTRYMKNVQGAEIKMGDNHPELFSNAVHKEEITTRFLEVLKGKTYSFEEKHSEEEYLNISNSPIKDNKGKIIGITTIITDITELKLKEIQLEKNNYSLNERIKELGCLFDISKIISNKVLSKLEKMEACVQAIPKALQFPEIANCHIQMFGDEYFSANYQQSDYFLKETITVNGENCGYIKIGYSTTEELKKENLFLDEEIKLLEALSDILSRSMERKLAEEKLKISEEKFRSIYESFDDVYFKKNIEGTLLDVSPSVEKHFKMSRESVIGQNAYDFYADRAEGESFYKTVLEKQEVNDYEERFLMPNGEIIYFSVNAKVIYNSDGEPAYFEGTMRNVNERILNRKKLLEVTEKIKESEKKYRTIFESVRDTFFRASAKDYKIIDISPSCTYFDLKQEEIIGKSIQEFYHNPEDQQIVLNELMQNGEIKNYDAKFLINSKTYNVSINSKILLDENNNPEFVVGSFRDITARIQAEEKLKISEAKFRSIFENFEDVYFRTTMDGTVLDVSPSFEKHFLRPCSYALENSVFDFYYDKQDRKSLLNKLKNEGQVRDSDIRFIDGEENIVFFSVNARLVYDENGNPIFIEKSMRNVNDRIGTQKEILIKNRQLEFQNIELEQFAYIASHDLQEPLITVIQCIDMLQQELVENLDEDQKQYLQFINSSTSRMQLLVKGLLDYSRIGKERKTSSINCNEIVANVLSDMNSSLKESNAIIEYESLPIIEGNTTEIRQLFQNMISNANKFRKKDQQPKIKIAAVKQENNWLFSIADNGIGIEEKDINKVFVIFKRLKNRNDYQGTGIGLSHCKKIIEQYKGKIWVESEPNQGSIFKWTFPIELH
ncbi:PAS domain S-box protein [Flavobacterium granuli]|uniref:histidine kinase n=1 Tax=Flavobacterium granuli TaxID=280093 RepID=A0ABU1S3M1_9FLAO|nr:PAS domain S-box protein [Flavobacterium granuli]MDR6845639.1 PAS domain S-box-containing protein [Flavobacterium granuli]